MLEMVKHYLHDEYYFISLYNNFCYFYKYLEIVKFTDKLISIKFEKFLINIYGDNLSVRKMEKKELLICGNILKLEKFYG